MKKIITLVATIVIALSASAQGVATKEIVSKGIKKVFVVSQNTGKKNDCKASAANAANIQAVKIYLKNGKTIVYTFDEIPVLTFDNDMINWKTNTTSSSYDFSEFDHYELVDATSGIENIEAEYKFSSNGNIVSVKGISDNDCIHVYDINGRMHDDCIDNNGSEATINLQSKGNGIYIIKLNNTNTYKIIKR